LIIEEHNLFVKEFLTLGGRLEQMFLL